VEEHQGCFSARRLLRSWALRVLICVVVVPRVWATSRSEYPYQVTSVSISRIVVACVGVRSVQVIEAVFCVAGVGWVAGVFAFALPVDESLG
jgi:hypothetical protein